MCAQTKCLHILERSEQLENMPNKIRFDQSFNLGSSIMETRRGTSRLFCNIVTFEQNDNVDFLKSERQYYDHKRFLNRNMFYKKLANGESVKRRYLRYS